ncbi:MAG: rRNA maturation RNase YbeY [Deinococcales bacterium]
MLIEIIDETESYDDKELFRTFIALMAELGLEAKEVTLVLVDDAAIQSLNREHRELDEPTDVLSYPSFEPEDEGIMPQIPFLGDIIISLDTAARQALVHGHSLDEEVKVLAAHGLTHLLGYDHETEEAWQIFYRHQKRILEL